MSYVVLARSGSLAEPGAEHANIMGIIPLTGMGAKGSCHSVKLQEACTMRPCYHALLPCAGTHACHIAQHGSNPHLSNRVRVVRYRLLPLLILILVHADPELHQEARHGPEQRQVGKESVLNELEVAFGSIGAPRWVHLDRPRASGSIAQDTDRMLRSGRSNERQRQRRYQCDH